MALHILDLLELTGSQASAAEALCLHQSTVCRSLRRMSDQFRLQPRRGARICRHGSNESLHLLRLAYRAHRLMEGRLRLATDTLHQPLLQGMATLQPVPPRFRSADDWAELVALALIDGAVVSSLCHDGALPPRWPGVTAVPLGSLPLQLVAPAPQARRVLLPRRGAAPVLHRLLEQRGFAVEPQPQACQDGAAWLQRLRDRGLAMPLGTGLLEPGWMERHGLQPLDAPPLPQELWLLLPEEAAQRCRLMRQCRRSLRLRVRRAGSTGPRWEGKEDGAAGPGGS